LSLIFAEGKSKCKFHPRNSHEGPEGEYKYSSTLTLTSALDGGGWSTPRLGRFVPGKDPIPIVQEGGWATRPVWKDAENLGSNGIRAPDRPACSESLYRLSYSAHRIFLSEFMTMIDKRR